MGETPHTDPIITALREMLREIAARRAADKPRDQQRRHTVATNNPPTEAEIRAAIASEWNVRPPVGSTPNLRFEDGVGACMLLTEGLYDTSNFRESEQALFDKMMFEAVAPIRKAARHDIEEALVTATQAFAEKFPDAPRAASDPFDFGPGDAAVMARLKECAPRAQELLERLERGEESDPTGGREEAAREILKAWNAVRPN